ncbi:MAG: hypothetical protein JWQ64_2181 [Subtercola sp.]|nr:hypothetical protein [Subtercola sp.]
MHTRVGDLSRIGSQTSDDSFSDGERRTCVFIFSRSWKTVRVGAAVLKRLHTDFPFPDRGGWFADDGGATYLVDLVKLFPARLDPALLARSDVKLVTRFVSGSPRVDEEAVDALEKLTRARFYIRRRQTTAPVSDPAERRTIRFFPDYGSYATIWEVGGLTSAKALSLSRELTQSIRRWYEHWEIHFAREMAWDSADQHDTYVREGRIIAAGLSQEVRHFAVVKSRFEDFYPYPS